MASLLSLGVVPGSGDSPMWASDDDSQSLTEIFGHLPNSPAMIKATSLFMFGAGQPAHCPAHLADSANDCPPSSSLSSAGSEDDVSSVLSLESMVAPSSPSSDTSGGSSPTMIKSEPQLTSSFFPAFGSAAPPALAASSASADRLGSSTNSSSIAARKGINCMRRHRHRGASTATWRAGQKLWVAATAPCLLLVPQDFLHNRPLEAALADPYRRPAIQVHLVRQGVCSVRRLEAARADSHGRKTV